MSNFNCSLSAFSCGKSTSRRRFIPPPRHIATVPWTSDTEMWALCGYIPGEWRLSTNQVGHVQGLPHIIGVKAAIDRTQVLLYLPDGKFLVICSSNFIGH